MSLGSGQMASCLVAPVSLLEDQGLVHSTPTKPFPTVCDYDFKVWTSSGLLGTCHMEHTPTQTNIHPHT